MEETIGPKRVKLQHALDFSSDPPLLPCSSISGVVTTMKVFLSRCRSDQGRVVELVDRLRKKLWEKGIEALDDDVERRVRVERYIPILIVTVGYFDDLDCLKELKVICESRVTHILPIFYDPDGELRRRVYTPALFGSDWYKPLNITLGTEWHDDDDDQNTVFIGESVNDNDDQNTAFNGDDDDDGSGDDKDNDGDDDGGGDDNDNGANDDEGSVGEDDEGSVGEDEEGSVGEDDEGSVGEDDEGSVGEDDEGSVGEDDGDGMECDDDNNKEEVDRRDKSNLIEKVAEEDEFTLGRALAHIHGYIEWMREPVINNNEAERDYIDHFALLVSMFLNPAELDYTCLVGLDSHLAQLRKSYIFSEEESIYIAITGPEGSGKTTMAKFLYNTFWIAPSSFHHTRMISNPTSLSLEDLAVKVFCKEAANFRDDPWIPEKHEWLTRGYESWPLLIILDNINTVSDFEHVAPVLRLVPKNGSKIVFTTRDDSWLNAEVLQSGFKTCPLPALDVDSSLELFCLKAFKKNQPPKTYKALADNLVSMFNRVPVDLVHCSSQFSKMNKDDTWAKALRCNEDMVSLFWSKYVPRYSEPATTGLRQPKSEKKDSASISDKPRSLRGGHHNLLVTLWRGVKANSLDHDTERMLTICFE